MIRNVDTLPSTMTVSEAIAFFTASDKTHRSYPVISEDRKFVGLVSRGDILLWQRDDMQNNDTLAERLAEQEVTVGHEDDPVGLIADLMLTANTGRIAVVDKNSKTLLGLIARIDLLHLRRASQNEELERQPFVNLRTAR